MSFHLSPPPSGGSCICKTESSNKILLCHHQTSPQESNTKYIDIFKSQNKAAVGTSQSDFVILEILLKNFDVPSKITILELFKMGCVCMGQKLPRVTC